MYHADTLRNNLLN